MTTNPGQVNEPPDQPGGQTLRCGIEVCSLPEYICASVSIIDLCRQNAVRGDSVPLRCGPVATADFNNRISTHARLEDYGRFEVAIMNV